MTAVTDAPSKEEKSLPVHDARRRQGRIIFIGDFIATAYATGMGIWLRENSLFSGLPLEGYWDAIIGTAIGAGLFSIWNLALWTQGTRNFDVVGSGAHEYFEVARITAVIFALVVTVSYVFKLDIARGFVLFTFPVGLILMLSWRFTLNRNARKVPSLKYTPRALVLSSAQTPESFWDEVRVQLPAVELVETLEVDGSEPCFEKIRGVASSADIDFLVVGQPLIGRPGFLRELSWAVAGFDVRILAVSRLLRPSEPQIRVTKIFGVRFVMVDDPQLSRPQRFKKRSLDLFLTVGTLPVWLPLIVILGFLIKITTFGPMFYAHERIGQNNRPFRMWKLRTMVKNADQQLEDLLPLNEASGPLFKLKHDPRVTPIGRILRKTSLDELPQLFNVIKGEMSLVGPRPQLPKEVAQLLGIENRRHLVKPGVTGLWQTGGRHDTNWEAAVAQDLEYIHNWTTWLDFLIVLKTIPQVIKGRGV